MPHLVQVQDRFKKNGVRVVGVTDAGGQATAQFGRQHGVTYPLLGGAEADRKAWGIDMIWGSEIYLVNPDGKVVARGMDDTDEKLAAAFRS